MRTMKITFLVDDVWNFNRLIAERLQQKNHTVTFIDSSKIHFTYKNSVQRITNFFSKTFFNKNAKKGFLERNLLQTVENLPLQDCIIIINPDTFSQQVVNLLKLKTKRYIAHNYDSLDRHPLPVNHTELFDQVFSFDIQDVKKNDFITLLNNFIYTEKKVSTKPKNKMFMILSKSKEREIILSKIADVLDRKNIHNYEFIVVNPEITENINKNIVLTTKSISLDDVTNKVANAEILIDLVRTNQSGLSFRFFEAMTFHKKIITNNKNVMLYDFYNPNNILVINDDFSEIDDAFLNNAYEPVPENIYNNYTIDAWIKTVFNL